MSHPGTHSEYGLFAHTFSHLENISFVNDAGDILDHTAILGRNRPAQISLSIKFSHDRFQSVYITVPAVLLLVNIHNLIQCGFVEAGAFFTVISFFPLALARSAIV